MWDDDKLTWRDHIASVKQKCFGALAKAAEDEECSASRLEEDGLQCLCVATCRLLLYGVAGT